MLFPSLNVTLSLLLVCSWACRPIKTSVLHDIYLEDKSSDANGNARRHAASRDEILWTVHVAGCSGILLTPRYVLTADHCNTKVGDQLQTGWSILTRGRPDLEVLAIADTSEALDYRVLEVRWLTPIPKSVPYPPRVATSSDDVYSSTDADQGDELFTVGFPDDRTNVWTSTYSEGQAKSVQGAQLFFNAGVINGNSGGGVLNKETHMLISLANGGRRGLGEPGWDRASKEDPMAWNFGTGLWSIHRQSSLMQKLFPDGVNAFYADSSPPKTRIYLGLTGVGSQARFRLAASAQSERLLICAGLVKDCRPSTAGVISLKSVQVNQGRAFYESPASPEDMSAMTLVALDKSGLPIGQRQVLLEKGQGS